MVGRSTSEVHGMTHILQVHRLIRDEQGSIDYRPNTGQRNVCTLFALDRPHWLDYNLYRRTDHVLGLKALCFVSHALNPKLSLFETTTLSSNAMPEMVVRQPS